MYAIREVFQRLLVVPVSQPDRPGPYTRGCRLFYAWTEGMKPTRELGRTVPSASSWTRRTRAGCSTGKLPDQYSGPHGPCRKEALMHRVPTVRQEGVVAHVVT